MEKNKQDTSIGFIEDPYFNPEDTTSTPSLDDVEENKSYILVNSCDSQAEYDLFDFRTLDESLRTLTFEPSDGSLNIETEFYSDCNKNTNIIKYILKKCEQKQVRVLYSDLTKPYMVKITGDFKEYLGLKTEEALGAEGINLSEMSADEIERQRMIWQAELAEIEKEIATFRTVLASKIQASNELKRKLGITVWREITDDVNQGIRNVKESNVFQKTSSILGGITGTVTNKLGQMRHSESFRSIEEKMGNAYENVKTKMVSSRSNSMQSLDEALSQNATSGTARSSAATSPTIPEEKPLV